MTKRSKDKAARHIRLYHWLLRSEAWQSLSANARAIYIEMATRYNGSNNGQIPFSVRDAANRAHIGKNAADAALTLLQARGFIVATRRGGFNVKTKIATEWRLTEFSCAVDHSFATKDFMRWSPEKQNTVPKAGRTVPVAGQHGTCGGTVVTKVQRNGTRGGTVKA
jgi:DNA-binding transcriptional regulator YhcF (GntR family)